MGINQAKVRHVTSVLWGRDNALVKVYITAARCTGSMPLTNHRVQ